MMDMFPFLTMAAVCVCVCVFSHEITARKLSFYYKQIKKIKQTNSPRCSNWMYIPDQVTGLI